MEDLFERLRIIQDKYHFHSIQKLKAYIKRKKIKIPNKLLRNLLNETHDEMFIRKYNKKLMGNSFSAIDGVWQMDIYFDHKKPYLLLINLNTRFACIYKMKTKASANVLKYLVEFANDFNPSIIECDNDSSFTTPFVLQFLKTRGITLHISLNQLHTDLSIINALCKRLNTLKDEFDSLEEAIKIYNKTPHASLNINGELHSPKEVQNNRDLQYNYIYNQLLIRDGKERLLLKDPIKKGDAVRYVIDEDRKAKKFEKNQRKYKLSKSYYRVEKVKSPFTYLLIAEDGSIKTVPRYRLYKHDVTKSKIKFAKTMEDQSNYNVYDRIIDYDYNPKLSKCKYKIILISRNSEGQKIKKDLWINPRYLRDEFPNRLSELELEFLNNNKNKYYYDSNKNMLVPI